MKKLPLIVLASLGIQASALAAATPVSSSIAQQDSSPPPYTQLFTLQAGEFTPAGIRLSNGNYAFNYGNGQLNSYLVEAGWAARLFEFLGSVYIEENVGFSTFSGTVASSPLPLSTGKSLSLYLVGLDSRAMYAMDWFPWKVMIPFVEGGYQYMLYNQAGSTDIESAQGGVGNLVAGAGVRLWLNRKASISHDDISNYAKIPIFVTAKVNRIVPSANSSVDLSSTLYLAGISVGF